MRSTSTRLALGGATAVAALSVSLAAVPAHAESAGLNYLCQNTESGQGSDKLAMTARFDSAMKDGATVPIGTSVALSPVQGTFTLSAEFVAAIRAYEIDNGSAFFSMKGYVVTDLDGDSSGDRDIVPAVTEFKDGPFTFTSNSAVTLKDTGTAPAFTVRSPQGLTYAAGEISATFAEPGSHPMNFICRFGEGTEDHIDSVKGGPRSTATPTPTSGSTSTPSRPAVVQTDARQPSGGMSWWPLAVAGAGSMVLLGGAAAVRRRGARR